MINNQRFLVLVVGPTAVGKSELCLNLAKKFQTEIVSCDSRQFYRELHLGTAKPSPEEMEQVPHHFIDSLSIEDAYDVRKFEQEALLVLERLFASKEVVVMAGGSGLYAQAIVQGLDEVPSADPQVRKEIITSYEVLGLEWLQSEVERVDPEFFDKVDRNNPQRLMRALEVFRCSGLKFSSFRIKSKVPRPFQTLKIGLDLPREELYHRIDQRMENMLTRGLFEEARSLFDKRHLNALQTLGYTEIFGFLEGKYDKEEMFRLLKRNSRRYAKRQLTWFRKDNQINWFHPSQEEAILHYLISQMD
ncbi:MAG: tRNA (adenosine(37)-N6)-dimethylallyltransferase MiaA [Bacteroidota bacterium]|jgi:tRNA dimethylallyltransferase|nr:tRNA (adenosine(37)-N6)-dimethylallyltransferase MiaA [Algoriphagus sp.]